MNQRPEILYHNPMFKELKKREVDDVLNYFQYKKIKKNQILFNSSQTARYIFIVVTGDFLIYVGEEENYKLVARAKSNDILGEAALLTDTNYGAMLKAASDSEIIKAKKKDFFAMLDQFPQIAINLVKIEAQRMRRALGQEERETINKKLIVHINYGNPVDSMIGLNIAAGMRKSLSEGIAYLHLSSDSPTPFSLLNFKVSENRLMKTLDKLRNYKKFDSKEILFKHKSGLYFLPSLKGKPAADILNSSDLPPLFSALREEFDHVFIELGSRNLRTSIALSTLRHAEQVIIGFVKNAKEVELLLNDLEYFQNKITEFSSKILFYEDIVKVQDNFYDQIYETTGPKGVTGLLPVFAKRMKSLRKKYHESTKIDPSPNHREKEELSQEQIESKIKHPINFKLLGSVFDHSELIQSSQLLVNADREHKLSQKFLSIGRILTEKSIGIAFGGGGARTISELGAIRVFEEEKISFDHISGTSMGALVGALFAKGLSSKEIEELFAEKIYDDKTILDYGFPLFGFFRGKKVDKLMEDYFGDILIEDLPIRFTCVAADLISGKEYHFTRGVLWKALRASMSIPVVFPPVKYMDKYFIDGAALNNVPGNLLKETGCQFVIGVNCDPFSDTELSKYLDSIKEIGISSVKKRTLVRLSQILRLINYTIKRPPILSIASRTMMIEGAELMRNKAHYFDYLLNLNVSEFGLFDFHMREELIRSGEDQTRTQIKQIKKALNL